MGTHNRVKLPLVFFARRLHQDLVKQAAGLGVGLARAFNVASVVELDSSVGFLEGTREHGLLGRRSVGPVPAALGGVGAAVGCLRAAAGVAPRGREDLGLLAAVLHGGGRGGGRGCGVWGGCYRGS